MSFRASAWRNIGERAIAMPDGRCAIPKHWSGLPVAKECLRLIFTETDVTRSVRARARRKLRGHSEPVLPEYGEPSINEMLSDPIVRALMGVDGVHADELAALLCSVAKRLERAVQSRYDIHARKKWVSR
jgi:hypothetical protein